MNFVHTIGIPVALTMIVVALIWILIGVRGSWSIKLALIVAVPFVTLGVWSAMDSYLGWPSAEAMPKKSLLVWADIREPRPGQEEPGAIFVWSIPLDDLAKKAPTFLEYTPSKNEPRSYRLPYTRSLHRELIDAMKEVARGNSFIIQGQEPAVKKNEVEICPIPGSGDDRAQKRIYRLPPVRPQKYPNQQ